MVWNDEYDERQEIESGDREWESEDVGSET